MAKTTKKTVTKTSKYRNLCPNENAHRYGNYYWIVQLNNGRQWIHADRFEIEDGHLILVRDDKEEGVKPNVVFAPGAWLSCHQATVLDGDMLAVAHAEFDDE